jgi:hypothetical protein
MQLLVWQDGKINNAGMARSNYERGGAAEIKSPPLSYMPYPGPNMYF